MKSTDRELCRQAQEIALNDLAPVYNNIYAQLQELLDVKVDQGNILSVVLITAQVVMAVIVAAVIVTAMILSSRFGKKIASGIAGPLRDLGVRLKSFAQGDLSSPFPTVHTGDEVKSIRDDSVEMAEHLNSIITDIGEVLGEMANGNYAVRSKASEKYSGDFQKLYASMRGLRNQMAETLRAIGEASHQVSFGSGDLAKASQTLAEGARSEGVV